MLSILIPVFNYNVLPLVNELVKQCNLRGITFEILCQDDASNSTENIQNQEIISFSNCSFFINETNLGRGKNINSLAQKAKYNWLLILDCDTFPTENNFIQNYISTITDSENIFFGGIIYEDKKPEKEQLLRWIYGQKRETSAVLSSNLLIKKEVFLQFPFDESITKYGYEDLLFFAVLKKNSFKINQIENPTFHLNLETSEVFLTKTKTALENLFFLYNSKKISSEESKIIKSFELLKSLKLIGFTRFLFNRNRKRIEYNLLSENPSLFYFDIYKLGYFCFLNS
ncbi:Glycosyltransferase involved in cell wall bisynthesis [Flavobacterium resistens]|uniref:Glycosyltransferase n=1 Tax=Flavobacterium resistens TaxID=443612 RepID=A0A521BJL5_9FLAO|nr:glycosyltransferase family 2 protein [Flavobacterium resistens]MRX67429.1 glycosyltransferase [Flavobacterium resistens]SMO47285.1 Glycosyltransferase involved in cell wall bisynthesis [Flavobacterium resistens]